MNFWTLVTITVLLSIAIASDIMEIHWQKDLKKEEENKRLHNLY